MKKYFKESIKTIAQFITAFLKHLTIAALVFGVSSIMPIVVGSNVSVSLQPVINFPAADMDNTMLGFAWFKNGFNLQDQTTSCTFDCVYPVSGSVNLNNGTLFLNQDLIFHDVTSLQTLGTVIGNGHYIDFCTSISGFPETTNTFKDTVIYINNDFTLTSSLIFQGNCIFNGNGNSLWLTGTGSIVVDSNSSLKLANVTLRNVGGNNISCVDDTGQITFETISLVQNSDFAFNQGSLDFVNNVDWVGSYTFLYASSQTSTIEEQSQLHFSNGIFFSIGRYSDSATVEPLAFVDNSSILALENATLNITQHGAQFTKGKFAIIRDVDVSVTSTVASSAAYVGDGSMSDDISFELYPACNITFSKGLVVFDVTAFNIIESRSSSATLTRLADSIFEVKQDIILSNVTINEQIGAITNVDAGKTSLFQNVILTLPTGSVILNGYNLNATSNLLNGDQSIFVVTGVLPLLTFVSNAGNSFAGNGDVGQTVILQDSNAELNWGLNGNLLVDMIMNGGSINLLTDFTLGSDVVLSGSCVVHLNSRAFNLGQVNLSWTDPVYWDGTSGSLNLFSNVALDNTWTFSGDCMLNGNGHSLNLSAGSLVIEEGSKLTISNITLQNVSATNIQCLNDAGVIILDNVKWQQSGDFALTKGSLQIANTVHLHGIATFAYQTDRVSLIQSNATLILDSGFTFSYDTSAPNLLTFADSSATFELNNSSLITTSSLELTKGTLLVMGSSFIGAETIVDVDNSITFGDCASAYNDFTLHITNSAQLEFSLGSLTYKNLNINSFIMDNTLSTLYMFDNTTLNLYQSITNLGPITFGNNCVLAQSPDANINGGINEEGSLSFEGLISC